MAIVPVAVVAITLHPKSCGNEISTPEKPLEVSRLSQPCTEHVSSHHSGRVPNTKPDLNEPPRTMSRIRSVPPL